MQHYEWVKCEDTNDPTLHVGQQNTILLYVDLSTPHIIVQPIKMLEMLQKNFTIFDESYVASQDRLAPRNVPLLDQYVSSPFMSLGVVELVGVGT